METGGGRSGLRVKRSLRGSCTVYRHIHMFICVNCPLEVTLKHLKYLQGVQAILSTSQSHYLDVFESRSHCVWMQERFYGYSVIVRDKNSGKQNKEDQTEKLTPLT